MSCLKMFILLIFWCYNTSAQAISQTPFVPYYVSIQVNLPNRDFKHICSGSIINKQLVLSAAHCFIRHQNSNNLQVVPAYNILNSTSSKQNRQVVKIVKHDQFYPLNGNDIALLKIKPSFTFDKYVDKISFKPAVDLNGQEQGYLISSGTLSATEQIPFRTLGTDQCVREKFLYLTDTEICALAFTTKGACDGDSGGPLVNNEKNLQWGILSYGKTICKTNKIYVFTRIKPLIPWIEDQMAKLLN